MGTISTAPADGLGDEKVDGEGVANVLAAEPLPEVGEQPLNTTNRQTSAPVFTLRITGSLCQWRHPARVPTSGAQLPAPRRGSIDNERLVGAGVEADARADSLTVSCDTVK